MLRAKAIKFRKGEVKASEKFLASTDVHGQFAGIPIVVQAVNAINKTKLARGVMESALDVDKNAWMPELATSRFRWGAKKKGSATEVKDGKLSPGKVAIFATCYVNYNEPGIGHDLIRSLEHNAIPYTLVEKESCCGMPKAANIPVLARYAREGYAILSAIPSCTLMFKQELPLLFPDDADVKAVQAAMFDPFEYLMARHKDGLLKTDFKHPLGKVSYHVPCHGRVQKIGKKTEELLKLIGQSVTVQLNTVERCSGHAGTYGVKKPYHATAMKIGKPVFKLMARDEPDWISSDCQLAGHHIAQGMAVNALPAAKLAHPLSLLRIAYGL
jgi:Fe-S oxidoreductase